jgi:hypothetical protein
MQQPRGPTHQLTFIHHPYNGPYYHPCRLRNPDDARDTFKTLKNQLIGDSSAHLYAEWAKLEQSAGNTSKALGILSKGLREGAQPAG